MRASLTTAGVLGWWERCILPLHKYPPFLLLGQLLCMYIAFSARTILESHLAPRKPEQVKVKRLAHWMRSWNHLSVTFLWCILADIAQNSLFCSQKYPRSCRFRIETGNVGGRGRNRGERHQVREDSWQVFIYCSARELHTQLWQKGAPQGLQ